MKKPYIEKKLSKNIFFREFKQITDSNEFVWHKDKEDRIIESIEKTNWLFQLDNELPIKIDKKLFIPKETYHRIIKGTGNLLIKVEKLE
jgi:hypothetical protein